jgi:L-lactate dehydrogenase complex protein LldG
MVLMSRDKILGEIRASLGRPELTADGKAEIGRRLANPVPNLIPGRARLDHRGQLDLFEKMATAAACEVIRVREAGEVPAAIAAFLRKHNLPLSLAQAPAAALDALPWEREPMLSRTRGAATPTDLVSLTTAFAGIAETGTLMLTSGAESPTTLNFLPDNHVVVLNADQVVGVYEEGWARLRNNGGMPRTVNFVTGPSRTGDIEQTIYMGAHGPRRLHIILIDPDAAPQASADRG